MRQTVGQHGFRAFVEIESARIDAVMARPRNGIGHRNAAIIGAKKPGISTARVAKPLAVMGRIERRMRPVNRRPCLDRLLVKRTGHGYMSAEAFGPDGRKGPQG